MRRYSYIILYLSVCALSACHRKNTLFESVSSSNSSVTFDNKIVENDTMNPLNVVNIYNGGGVGIGDFNNDGLQDIFFGGNMVPSRLYLNKGNFKFEDITGKAGVEGMGRWARGISIIDINNDGLPDIYIANTIYKDSLRRRNILYINQGVGKDGIPHFKDMAAEYGLDIHVQSTMASFFDYDNDGDLDMYLTVNEASNGSDQSVFLKRASKSSGPSVGRLFRNDWDPQLKHGVFHDVSQAAGVTLPGFGHAATIVDINGDGWKDIYVSNDFISDNILYINNHDGTFTDHAKEYFKHTSLNAMGQDVIDINNDGLPDVVELDMSPKDNYRKKMMSGANNYVTYQNFEMFGYQYQYVRNTLQLNQGRRLLENDSVGAPAFSDIGFMSGISQTDWSWTPLVTDFDNDGYRDVIITNGFPKDVSDHDFIAYRAASVNESVLSLLKKIPVIKLANFGFKNKDGIDFEDVSAAWGLTKPSFSNGAAYVDLDNDGDMDMVINNINDEAFIYKNTLREGNDTTAHFIQIKFKGGSQNIDGIGAIVDIYYNNGKHQTYENMPYRGYLSSDQNIAHFGLGRVTILDSVVLHWPGNKKQTLINVKADQVLKVNIDAASEVDFLAAPKLSSQPLFKEITQKAGINYNYRDVDFIDFNVQTTLPHKLSQYCPALAVGDIDGNGLDDIAIGGNTISPTVLLLQQKNGQFIRKDLQVKDSSNAIKYKDEGMLLFDANGDGKPDLYIASGGYKFGSNSPEYQDRLYINNGNVNFTLATDALPVNHTSKLCVRAIDFNDDGKLDLFVSGRVDPGKYPKPVSSFIFRNDSENGKVKFTDVTTEVAPDLQNIGMVCDAIFTDFDNDHLTDLILTGEWMPVTFLKNVGGKFKNITAQSGVADEGGWWNSIVAGDFRHMGRMDYILGNVGQNTLYQASKEHPVYITAADFDHNGGYVPITSLFLPDINGKLKEFPAFGRDDILERIPSLRKRFNTYNSFATADMDEIFTPAMRKDAQRLKATMLQSCYLRNDGNGKFTMLPLPAQAQMSTLNGMVVDDFDGDGNLDVLINGNDFGTEVSIGRLDALNGLLLRGNGNGTFTPMSIAQSGIYLPGNGKSLVSLVSADGNYMVASSQNPGPVKLFNLNRKANIIRVLPSDMYALVKFKNGSSGKIEFYYGSSFLSQSGRFIKVNDTMQKITIFNTKGESRDLVL
jgi:hypothetical protein